VPVLDLALQAENGAAKVLIHEPTGQSVDASPFYQAEPYQQGGWRRAIERPMPGVWEVVIKNDQALTSPEPPDASPLPSVHYTMTARLLGAHLDSAGPTTSTASNTLAPFEGRIEGAGLGTAFNDRPILTASAPRRLYDIAVPPGTTLLSVDLEKPSDVSADVDLYLFDCTGKECTIKARSSRAGSIETISVRAPATGVWKAAVVADSLPSGEVQVGYRDLVVHPLFGRIDVADMSNAHATGASWQATSAVHVEAVPFANRRTLVGLVQVVADGVESSKHQQIVEADDRLATWREVGRWSIPLAIMPAVIPANAARATQ